MTTLTTDRQLDTHLKPLKSGEELSSLELSTKSNGARITGDLEVTGEIKGGSFADSNFIHIINTGWVGSTGKIYMPLNGYIIEKSDTASNNEFVSFVAPFDGELSYVIVRSEAACGSSVVGLHVSSAGVEAPNTTASAEVTTLMPTDDTAYKFDFSTVTSRVTAGEIIAISFDSTLSHNDTVATIVFKFDGNKPLGDSE